MAPGKASGLGASDAHEARRIDQLGRQIDAIAKSSAEKLQARRPQSSGSHPLAVYSRINSLLGQQFGRLTVIARAENGKHGHHQFICECDCGKRTVVTSWNLQHGLSRSCGRCVPRRHHRLITAWGRTQTIARWSREVGIRYATTLARFRRGWSPEDALSRPPRDNEGGGS
jgi:hypothetical protein